jgi:hypothetical protein
MLLIRTMLGLEPGPGGVRFDPHLPDGITRLCVNVMPGTP